MGSLIITTVAVGGAKTFIFGRSKRLISIYGEVTRNFANISPCFFRSTGLMSV